MSLLDRLDSFVTQHRDSIRQDPPRREMISDAITFKEALVSKSGALAFWTPPESTGRSPQDTVTVKRPESEKLLDWDSDNNIAIEESTFDMIFDDALGMLANKQRIYTTRRAIGADPEWSLPVTTITDHALTALFTDNMFRIPPAGIENGAFGKRPFTLLVLPDDKLTADRFVGRLRMDPDTKKPSTLVVAIDYDRRFGIVVGSSYLGSVKKLMFTVMNFYLPCKGVLPLHCSANEGIDGNTALMLGLSGTGKTTLSATSNRLLLGDDEHGWSENGIANFENGCYAKLLDLDRDHEPEIYDAIFADVDPLDHGSIVENALMYPSGGFDLFDERLTQNSRASYPLSFLDNVKPNPVGGHPKTILFLTADANGVLPPISRLDRNTALLWFLMGYTSKLAGTETGIIEPKSVFSRFFGQPFMPRNPNVYAEMLGQRLDEHKTEVFLVNTGWIGGPYRVGKRIDLRLTRTMVDAAISGQLSDVEYDEDPRFHVQIPRTCPGIEDPSILVPRNTWNDKQVFDARARRLAGEFAEQFAKVYGHKGIDPAVAGRCPGSHRFHSRKPGNNHDTE